MPGQNQSVKLSRRELRKLADFREMAEAHIERLGRAIFARRTELKWSRARLGREVNAHEKTVERWEKAQTAGALDNLEQIAAALDMEADNLLAKAMPERKPNRTPDLIGQLDGSQLDRIEKKLDDALERLEAIEAAQIVSGAEAADQADQRNGESAAEAGQ